MNDLMELKIKAVNKHLDDYAYLLVQTEMDIDVANRKQIIIPGAETDRNKIALALAQLMNKKSMIEKVIANLIELRTGYMTETNGGNHAREN